MMKTEKETGNHEGPTLNITCVLFPPDKGLKRHFAF